MISSPHPDGRPQRRAIPADHSEVCYWRVSDRRYRLVQVNVLSVLAFVLASLLFGRLASTMGRLPLIGRIDLLWLVMINAAIPLTIVLHELCHAAALRLLGAQPRFGFAWKQLLLSTAAPGYPLPRAHYILAMATPLVGLSLVAVAVMALAAGSTLVAIATVCAVVNVAGSVGDLWLIGVALRYPSGAFCTDESDGVRISLAVA